MTYCEHGYPTDYSICPSCESVRLEAEFNRVTGERDELRLYRNETERLKVVLNGILHPDGDGPETPSLCDLVAFVDRDMTNLEVSIADLETSLQGARDANKSIINDYRVDRKERVALNEKCYRLRCLLGELSHASGKPNGISEEMWKEILKETEL